MMHTSMVPTKCVSDMHMRAQSADSNIILLSLLLLCVHPPTFSCPIVTVSTRPTASYLLLLSRVVCLLIAHTCSSCLSSFGSIPELIIFTIRQDIQQGLCVLMDEAILMSLASPDKHVFIATAFFCKQIILLVPFHPHVAGYQGTA